MLNTPSTLITLAQGSTASLYRALILSLCVMGAQQASYVAAFFLLQTLWLAHEGTGAHWIAWVCVLLALALVHALFNRSSLVAAYGGSYALGGSLRLRLCDHVRRLWLSFFQKNDSGILCGVLIDDIKSMEVFFGMHLFDLASGLVFPFLLCVLMLFFSWQITGVLVLSAALAFPLILWACRTAQRLGGADPRVVADAGRRGRIVDRGVGDALLTAEHLPHPCGAGRTAHTRNGKDRFDGPALCLVHGCTLFDAQTKVGLGRRKPVTEFWIRFTSGYIRPERGAGEERRQGRPGGRTQGRQEMPGDARRCQEMPRDARGERSGPEETRTTDGRVGRRHFTSSSGRRACSPSRRKALGVRPVSRRNWALRWATLE